MEDEQSLDKKVEDETVDEIIAARKRIETALNEAESTISVGRHDGFIESVSATQDGVIEFNVRADGGVLTFEFNAVDPSSPTNKTAKAEKLERRTEGTIRQPDSFIGLPVTVKVEEDEAVLQVETRREQFLRRARLGLTSDVSQPAHGAMLFPLLLSGAVSVTVAVLLGVPILLNMLFVPAMTIMLSIFCFVPVLVLLDRLYAPLMVETER